jgi:hypothetical protein
MQPNLEQCPLCGTGLSEVKFEEIQAKLRLEEQKKAAAQNQQEAALRLRLEQRLSEELQRQQQTLEKKAQDEAEARSKLVASELSAAAKKVKEAETRELEVRKQAKEELDSEKLLAQSRAREAAEGQIRQTVAERDELAKKLNEVQQREADAKKEMLLEIERQRQAAEKRAHENAAEKVNALILERDQATAKAKEAEGREIEVRRDVAQQIERQKVATEARVRAAADEQIKKLMLERDQATKKAGEAEAREADVRRKTMEEATKERLKELANQRETLETDKTLALLKQQSEFNRQRESFQSKLHILEKQVQNKTANELGDGAEIDLYETLREWFPTDKIDRVPKGQAGGDILHEVLYKGDSCGRVIIDCKNRQSWQYAFVTKLRQDQIEAGAEHAILATTVFPSGKKEMSIESSVIVVSPARVAYIVQLLRNAMVTMHVKGLSMKERSTKMARLYKLITSDAYTQKLAEATKLTEEILEIDVQEKKTHDNVWKKRGSLAKRAQNVLREAETELAAVIESTEDGETPPTFGVKSLPNLAGDSQAQEIV